MSSDYSSGVPGFYGGGGGINTGRSTRIPMNRAESQIQFPQRLPVAGILPDGGSQHLHRRQTLIGKRSLGDFQQQQQFQFLQQQQQVQQGLGFYLRNVNPRTYQHASPNSRLSPLDFAASSSSISSEFSSVSPMTTCHALPILQTLRSRPVISMGNKNGVLSPNSSAVASYLNQVQNSLYQVSEEKMMNQLQELEKQLLEDNNEDEEDTVSVVTTNNQWSETIKNLVTPNGNHHHQSPTSSCSSSMESPPVSSPKQSIVEAATAITDGKTNVAVEILTRLSQVADVRGSSEQRLTAYMVSALNSRVNSTEYPPPVLELQSKEHAISSQNLYELSPCFKLGFMAANLAILESVADHPSNKLHVIDFDIGQGGQYLHLLHTLATKKTDEKPASLKITAITDFMGRIDEKVKSIGNDLKTLANKIGVCLIFNGISCKITDLSREKLGVERDEILAVNFAYRLYRLPDESVTTENLRDELLRRVKGLSPKVVTLVEQELNGNTAAFVARVNEVCGYYGALLDSLDATVSRDEMGRAKIEEGLSRKVANSVACEGRDRVERCEVFGKWRARMTMAGFEPRPMCQPIADSLLKKLNSGPRGNPGFTVNEQSGGICFGWMGRTLTVASGWC